MDLCWVWAASLTLAAGCTLERPAPRTEAAVVEAKCSGPRSANDARIVGPSNVDAVEPLYAVVYSTPNGAESRLIGAKIHIRTIDGVTAESVGHALVCHAAHETLSGPRPSDLCPYFVPGVWVDIDVKPDAMGYEVALRGQDFEEARQILDRAKAFTRN